MDEEDKKKIDDFLDKFGDSEYLQETYLKGLTTSEILEYVDANDCYYRFGNSLLEEFTEDELIEHLEDDGYLVDIKNEKDTETVSDWIGKICNELHPRGYLTKEDRKQIINDYIDFWY